MKHTRIFTRHLHSRDCKKRYLKGDYCECLNNPVEESKEKKNEDLNKKFKFRCSDGKCVRSMGEREVYEWLKREGMDPKYECEELKFIDPKDGKEKSEHPDFHISGIFNGKNIKNLHVEYIGTEPDSSRYKGYCLSNKEKYNWYIKNGITVVCLIPEDLWNPDFVDEKNQRGIAYKLLHYENGKVNYMPNSMKEILEL